MGKNNRKQRGNKTTKLTSKSHKQEQYNNPMQVKQ